MSELLLSMLNLVGGSTVGYISGLRQGRKKAQYERRVRVIAEVRKRLREARRAFAYVVTFFVVNPEPGKVLKPEEIEEVGKALDALAHYLLISAQTSKARILAALCNRG